MPTRLSLAFSHRLRPVLRLAARASFIGGLVLGCLAVVSVSGCSSIETIMAIEPPDEGWQTLPVDDLLSRDSVTITSLVFCRRSQCGDDIAIASFNVSGRDAAQLEAALEDPTLLKRVIDKAEPVAATPRAGMNQAKASLPRAVVAVERIRHEGWRGVSVSIEGGTKQRHAHGVIYAKRERGTLRTVLVVAGDRTTADRFALEALN